MDATYAIQSLRDESVQHVQHQWSVANRWICSVIYLFSELYQISEEKIILSLQRYYPIDRVLNVQIRLFQKLQVHVS